MAAPDATDPDHPVSRLASVLAGWAAWAPAGERTPTLLIDVLDSVGRTVGRTSSRVQFTERQADELAAALTDAEVATSSAGAIAGYLDCWLARPGEHAAAQLSLTDWRVTDDDLDDGAAPAPTRIPISGDRIDDLTGILQVLLDQLLLARQLVRMARFQEGAKVRVHIPHGVESAAAATTGTVAYVRVSLPGLTLAQLINAGEPVRYLYHVRLDDPRADRQLLILTEDELAPVR